MSAAPPPARVALEVGKTWTFAAALDWPGWCRRGKGEQDALDALLSYAGRYKAVAGRRFRVPKELTVVGTVAGNATTDFGAPAVAGPWDSEPLPAAEAARMANLVAAAWTAFDAVVAGAPAKLRKGPRGGGRDRDAIVEHVRDAERAYGRKFGVRVPPRTPWPEQRDALLAALRDYPPDGATDGAPDGASDGDWPVRYALRRVAWHVLDHAWEIEDKSD